MKKVLLIICFLASASMIFVAQSSEVTMRLSETMVTPGVPQDIEVGVTIDYMTPGNTIVGVQLSLLYDETLLSWNGTMTNPAPGVSYQNPGFTPVTPFGDYLWNTGFTNGNLIMTWIDPTYMGFPNPDGDDLIRYWFHYNGGLLAGEESPITFSLTAKLQDGSYIKIVNELTDQNFTPMDFVDNPYGGGCGSGLCAGRIYTDTGGGIPGLWTGDGDGINWFDPDNWDDDNVPVGIDVTINADGGKAPMVIISGGDATTGMLTVAPGAGIQVDPTGTLTTNGLYTNDGELVITSDMAGGSGSFIDNGGLAGIGTFHFDRYLSTGAPGSHAGWHYVSTPVNNTVSGDFAGYWLKSFDPASGMFMDIDPYSGSFCETSMNTVAVMGGMGYSVKQDLNYAADPDCPPAEHVPTTGDYVEFGGDHLMGYGGSAQSPADPTNMGMMANIHTGTIAGLPIQAGWNLMGNPYPSGWHYDIFWAGPNFAAANINDAIYYWDDSGDQYASYVNGVGANGGSWEVPPTQGFFFEGVGAGTMTFDNSERIHTAVPYYKEEKDNVLRLQATANGYTDETVIYFQEEATANFDGHYDAKKLTSTGSGVPSLYTPAGSEILSINGQPSTNMVPLSFSNDESGTYTIEATSTTTFSEVYLQDLVTGDVADLMLGSYTFDYTAGEIAERFIIHFAPVGIGENLMNSVSIWSAENNIYVSVPKELKGTIAVYNMMGQEVVSTDTQPGTNVIPMENVNTYYVVKVLSSKNAVTGKVYIK